MRGGVSQWVEQQTAGLSKEMPKDVKAVEAQSLSAQKPWHITSPSLADSVISKTWMMSKRTCILREIGAPATGAGP